MVITVSWAAHARPAFNTPAFSMTEPDVHSSSLDLKLPVLILRLLTHVHVVDEPAPAWPPEPAVGDGLAAPMRQSPPPAAAAAAKAV